MSEQIMGSFTLSRDEVLWLHAAAKNSSIQIPKMDCDTCFGNQLNIESARNNIVIFSFSFFAFTMLARPKWKLQFCNMSQLAQPCTVWCSQNHVRVIGTKRYYDRVVLSRITKLCMPIWSYGKARTFGSLKLFILAPHSIIRTRYKSPFCAK